MSFNPQINIKLNELKQLAEEVKASDEVVRSKLSSRGGKFSLWFAEKMDHEVPDWASHHIAITTRFKQLLEECKALTQPIIPPETREKIRTTKDLAEAIEEAEKKNESIPKEILATLKESQDTVSNLARHMLAPKFKESIEKGQLHQAYVDPNRLMVGDVKNGQIDPSKYAWHLNLALLMNIYKRTDDPDLKRQISFLVLNYLAKAAPVNIQQLGLSPEMTSNLEDLFQLGFFQQMGSYHRESSTFEKYVRKEILEDLPLLGRLDFVLTDTIDIESLLPAKFPVIATATADEEKLLKDWTADIAHHILHELKAKPDAKIEDLDELDTPHVVDFTKLIGEFLKTKGVPIGTQVFEEKLKHYESLMEQAIAAAVQQIKKEVPDRVKDADQEKKLDRLIKQSILCISTIEIKKAGAIVILPLFGDPKFDLGLQRDHARDVGEFINQTGIRIGGVRGREVVFNFVDLADLIERAEAEGQKLNFQPVEYAVSGVDKPYFTDPLQLINTEMFKRMEKRFAEAKLPHARLLGLPTLQLIKGLCEKISTEKWIALNADPDKRQILQTSLYKLMVELARADYQRDNFTKFTQAIELVHCEIATILALTSPYQEKDFNEIYKHNLTFVPADLQKYVKAGITKSAMNAFAGINAAIKSVQPEMQRAYGEGSYFEEVGFIGSNRSTKEIVQNPSIERVDLYVGEFNHNINVDPSHSHYIPGDIQGDVEALLQAKPKTEHLTVAVDCTIDFIHSDKAKQLLERFSKEIKEGKLNFVFFRSGQKFDMLGMDNYYGGTFFMINNGAEYWKGFDDLVSRDSFKTDSLSQQWFCLINQCAPQATDAYRKQIFDNTRMILSQMPEVLKPGNNDEVRISTVAQGMDPCFIDIKLTGKKIKSWDIEELLYPKFIEHQAKIHFRGSFGFYHANVNFINGPGGKVNVRINPGLNPEEVQYIVDFLKELAEKVKSLS